MVLSHRKYYDCCYLRCPLKRKLDVKQANKTYYACRAERGLVVFCALFNNSLFAELLIGNITRQIPITILIAITHHENFVIIMLGIGMLRPASIMVDIDGIGPQTPSKNPILFCFIVVIEGALCLKI